MRTIVIEDRFAAWRAASLAALAEDLPPASIHWRLAETIEMPQQQASIDYAPASPGTAAASPHLAEVQVSKTFAALLRDAASFRDPQRWAFLYKVLWRWHHGDRSAASPADTDGSRLYRMAKSVRRAQHDMIAYVRFRKQADAQAVPEYLAWYEPEPRRARVGGGTFRAAHGPILVAHHHPSRRGLLGRQPVASGRASRVAGRSSS